MKRRFPFQPKSNAKLLPGDFWAVPLKSGKFACGRVLELPPKGEPGSKVSFLAGLLDWVGSELPTFESIGEARLIEQGVVHVKTITENNGSILGNRPLEIDNIEPFVCKDAQYFRKGYTFIELKPEEKTKQYPSSSTWGYRVIKIIADKYFDK